MAQRTNGSKKHHRAVPVKVSVDQRPVPAGTTPLPPIDLAPLPPPSPSPLRRVTTSAIEKPIARLRQPVHAWSESQRRRLMWWLVGGGAAVMIILWAAFVRYDFRGSNDSFFQETWRLLKSVSWPKKATPTPAEQEIQQFDQEVFGKFQ